MTKRTNNNNETTMISLSDVLYNVDYGVFEIDDERNAILDKLEEIVDQWDPLDDDCTGFGDFIDYINGEPIADQWFYFFHISDTFNFCRDLLWCCEAYVHYMTACGCRVDPLDDEQGFACGVMVYIIMHYVDLNLYYEYAKQKYKTNK